ncbi:hypothetical protein BDY17DRAFT_295240 [Neohortaea acidophila]|uniref:NmrA-like domain-containing protein n=1 Tax=Neohortaea acidophila TaxID=245834 RepID=A0A6A6PYC6_9PEZI|nr:uncharacterized protein BDY17DRAFT_295240 [Neohortaea acidophila]KAF2484227.1 hypothetical protein BDY17DRAFT_295240 [Neohortaea acidophila]
MNIKTVTLLGADGKLGPAILHALLAADFTVTVLKRTSSKSPDNTYPSHVTVRRVSDDFTLDTLVPVLQGQDAVVVTIKGTQTGVQTKLARACVQAGVRRFIPADFGSCDSSSAWAQSLVPLFKHKTELRDVLMQLADESKAFSWTSLVCGHFFDWSPEFLHVWVRERRAETIDGGHAKWSASTLARIGEATARILLRPEETENRVVYVQSFLVSQVEVVRAYERATDSQWAVKDFESKRYEREEKAKADGGDREAVENLVWLLGTLDGNWEEKDGFAMKLLGLENENLDAVVRGVVEEHASKS